ERRLVQERPTISRMLLKIAVQFRAPVRLAINRMLRRTGPTLQRTVLKTAATRTSQIGTYHVRLRPTRRDKDNRGSSRVSIPARGQKITVQKTMLRKTILEGTILRETIQR